MERLLKYFEPEKYILNLKVDKHQKYIGGEVTVLLRENLGCRLQETRD